MYIYSEPFTLIRHSGETKLITILKGVWMGLLTRDQASILLEHIFFEGLSRYGDWLSAKVHCHQ